MELHIEILKWDSSGSKCFWYTNGYYVHLGEHRLGANLRRNIVMNNMKGKKRTVAATNTKYSIAEARRNLPSLVRNVESGKVVELTRRGELVAVMVGSREFERLNLTKRKFDEAYREFTNVVGLAELGLDPDKVFSGLRHETAAREVRL